MHTIKVCNYVYVYLSIHLGLEFDDRCLYLSVTRRTNCGRTPCALVALNRRRYSILSRSATIWPWWIIRSASRRSCMLTTGVRRILDGVVDLSVPVYASLTTSWSMHMDKLPQLYLMQELYLFSWIDMYNGLSLHEAIGDFDLFLIWNGYI